MKGEKERKRGGEEVYGRGEGDVGIERNDGVSEKAKEGGDIGKGPRVCVRKSVSVRGKDKERNCEEGIRICTNIF